MKTTIRSMAALAVLALLQLFSTEEAKAQSCASPYAFSLNGPASITFDPAIDVGKVLWTGKVNSGSSTGNCSGGMFGITFDGTTAYLGANLYDSGIPGIAYRLQFANAMCYNGFWPGSCTPRQWAPGIGYRGA